MTQATQGNLIYFNGISGETGDYAREPMPLQNFASAAAGYAFGEEQWGNVKQREFNKQQGYGILPQFGDGSEIKKSRWGIIFPAAADPAQVDKILAALDPLVRLRETQMGQPAKIYRGTDGVRWLQPPQVTSPRAETKNEWLARQGAGPGPVDPTIVPYFLLIAADPQSIPYTFQYELDVQYAVGRLYFNTRDEYTRYATSVVAAAKAKLARKAVFFGPDNNGDRATSLSTEHLLKPLKQYVEKATLDFDLGWEAKLVEPGDSDRAALQTLLGGSQTPALLFTASHGMKFSYFNPDQYELQGALVCQDWKGRNSGPVLRQHYLAAKDVPENANLLGSVVFHFACFGAGTPYWDDFAVSRFENRSALAARPFISALPNRLLSHPGGGALAVIGHVDEALNFSFQWPRIEEQNTAYKGILYQLMAGKPVGLALENMNDRYSEIATMFANTQEDLKYNLAPSLAELAQIGFEYASLNDSRGYVILGDPAVSIPLAPVGKVAKKRPVISLPAPTAERLSMVLNPEALASLNETERKAVENENNGLPIARPVQPGDPAPALPRAPVQNIAPNPAAAGGAAAQPGQAPQGANPPLTGTRPFATPIDGLAFALQAYTSTETISFAVGMEGTSFGLLDDAKEKIKEVVVNLNTALGNLAKQMEKATSDLATLQVMTGVVDDLETFDPKTAEARILTRITAGGDIQVYLPRDWVKLDEDLLALHQSMVGQALTNRLEIARAVAEMVAGLFGGQK